MHNNLNETWIERFLDLSRVISSWSKDPSKKVGAVIVDANKKVVSVGYNGLPSWCNDDSLNTISKESKSRMMLHAEYNALSYIGKNHNYTEPFTIFVTDAPCIVCSTYITCCNYNINALYYTHKGSDTFQERYGIQESLKNLEDNGIDVHHIQ